MQASGLAQHVVHFKVIMMCCRSTLRQHDVLQVHLALMKYNMAQDLGH